MTESKPIPTPIRKGDTVYATLNRESNEYGIPYKVRMVKASRSNWHNEPEIYLEGSRRKCWSRPIHEADITPQERANMAEVRDRRARVAAAELEKNDRAKAHEDAVLNHFAYLLRADMEVGPVTYEPDKWESKVGAVVKFWQQQGRGLDTTVTQRSDWVGVRIRKNRQWDPVTGEYAYHYGVAFGGTTYSQTEARIMAESITMALAIIPTLPDPNHD